MMQQENRWRRNIKWLFTALFIVFGASALAAQKCGTCQRDNYGHIKRSASAKAEFQREHPCPSTGKRRGACPGYDIDHTTPLWCGGLDTPENMQWLTKRQHKEKSRNERKYGCSMIRKI